MEFSIDIHDIYDARDLFLLAKDRLLDINDWNELFSGNEFNITLTNSKGQKLHRDARVDDLLHIIATNHLGNHSDMWVAISKIQYDFFPDIRSESISMLLETTHSPSGNGIGDINHQSETILIKREEHIITAHCNAGNELPGPDADTPNVYINNSIELHPVLNIPIKHIQQLLKGLISFNNNAVT